MPVREKQEGVMYSLIVPLYKAEAYLSALMEALESLRRRLKGSMEAVFVLDGPTGHALRDLETALASVSFPSTLVAHSRNFGSLVAIRSGLAHATGQYCAVMSADLQEPPELFLEIFNGLSKDEA